MNNLCSYQIFLWLPIYGLKIMNKLGQGRLAKYVKNRLGYGSSHHESIYQLATQALKKDGIEFPSGVTWKKFVLNNEEHIVKELKKIHVPRKPKKIKAYSVSESFALKDSFLSSFEWRRVRMYALTIYGAKCQCCGATPANGAVMNVDHIKPRKLFPELALDIQNLQVLCHECNHGKGNWDQTDWRKS